MIWQDKKLYNRAYGNAGMLEGMLHNAGYTRGQFIGIEFPIIFHGDKYDGRLVLPFVDREERGGCYARIKDKDTVVICPHIDAQFELNGPEGTVEVPLSALKEVGLLPKAKKRRSPQISETSQNPFWPHTIEESSDQPPTNPISQTEENLISAEATRRLMARYLRETTLDIPAFSTTSTISITLATENTDDSE